MNGIEHELFEYNSIIQETNEIYRGAARRLGLSESTFWILYALRTSAIPMTQSGLRSALCLPKQTVNSALKSLERSGFIELDGPGGVKGKAVLLTEAGRRLTEDTAGRVVRAEVEAFSKLGSEERHAFLGLMHSFTALLAGSVGAIEGEGEEK